MNSDFCQKTILTTIGPLTISVNRNGVIALGRMPAPADACPQKDISASLLSYMHLATTELAAYFAGDLQEFSVPVQLSGTVFQKKVWQALCRIPYGKTISYTALADAIAMPKAVRAVAGACAANPVIVLVPCHRVINKNGALGGYSGGGIAVKKKLLDLEVKKMDQQSDFIF